MLNKVFLMGRLVADPETKQTPSGVPVTTFRIAVDRDFKNKQTGEKEADFVTIVAWRSTAEFVARYFTKGRMAVVEGRLQIRPYTDGDGNKRFTTEVVADSVYFGDSQQKENDDVGDEHDAKNTAKTSKAKSKAKKQTDDDDDLDVDGDMPF